MTPAGELQDGGPGTGGVLGNRPPDPGSGPHPNAGHPAADPEAVASRRQLGLLWGGVALALILLSPLAPHLAAFLPPCPLKTYTGIPCPGCGTTRAALALGRLDLAGALAVSPLAALGWSLLVGGGLAAGALALARRDWPPPLRAAAGPWSPGLRLALGILLAAHWLYLVLAGV